jgi:hypothetical protein
MQSVLRRRSYHPILLLTLLVAVALGWLVGPSSAAARVGGGLSFGRDHYGGLGSPYRHYGRFGSPYRHYGGPAFSLGLDFWTYDYPIYPYYPAYPYPVYEYPAPDYPFYVYPSAPPAPASPPAPAPGPSAGRRQSELRVQPAGKDALRLTWSGNARAIESVTFALLDRQRAGLASIDIDVPPFVATLQTLPEATSASATVRYRSGETKTVTLPLRRAPYRPGDVAGPAPSESPGQPRSTPSEAGETNSGAR